MVNYTNILKVMDEYVEKCIVTLKSIRQQISPILKDITDTEEEYNILMDIIPKFYRDNWNNPKEHLLMQGNNGDIFENEGTEGSVSTPREAVNESMRNGLVLSIHNHPSDSTAYQSLGDYVTQCVGTREKYGITISKKDGVVISKLTNKQVSRNKLSNTYNKLFKKIGDNFDKDKEVEIQSLKDDCDANKITSKQLNKKYNEMFHGYISENIHGYVDNLDTSFSNNNVPVRVYHAPIKRGG